MPADRSTVHTAVPMKVSALGCIILLSSSPSHAPPLLQLECWLTSKSYALSGLDDVWGTQTSSASPELPGERLRHHADTARVDGNSTGTVPTHPTDIARSFRSRVDGPFDRRVQDDLKQHFLLPFEQSRGQ